MKEVLYSQEPYAEGIDYGRVFRFWHRRFKPSPDWQCVPSVHPDHRITEVRVVEGTIQALSMVDSHSGEESGRVSEALVDEFQRLKLLHPLAASDSVSIYVGRSAEDQGTFYLRTVAPPCRLTPYVGAKDLAQLLDYALMGIEEADDMTSGGEFWVAYSPSLIQSDFADAYERLMLLCEWLEEASSRMYSAAERYFESRAKGFAARKGTG